MSVKKKIHTENTPLHLESNDVHPRSSHGGLKSLGSPIGILQELIKNFDIFATCLKNILQPYINVFYLVAYLIIIRDPIVSRFVINKTYTTCVEVQLGPSVHHLALEHPTYTVSL